MSSLYYVFNGLPSLSPGAGVPLALESGGKTFQFGRIKTIDIVPTPKSILFVRLRRESVTDEAYSELEKLITTKDICSFISESLKVTVQIESIFDGISGGTFEHSPIPYPDRSVFTATTICKN